MRVLLLDGDTLVYQAGREAEQATDWGDGHWTLHAEESDGSRILDELIDRIREGTNADRVIVALSDYDNPNWRLSVMPTYKQDRAKKKSGSGRPILWAYLRAYFQSKYETYIRPGLEGDDVLGILATTTNRKVLPWGSERIICSIDKDLKTIPAFHLNFTRAQTAFGWEVTETTLVEADAFHLKQALMGDKTDGYDGCKGIGTITADKLLEPFLGRDEDGRISAMDRAGAWKAIVKAYEKAGQSETEALQNARVARICRASDYNFQDKTVNLWNPTTT